MNTMYFRMLTASVLAFGKKACVWGLIASFLCLVSLGISKLLAASGQVLWGSQEFPRRGIIVDSGTPNWIRHLLAARNFYRHDIVIWNSAAIYGIDPNLWKAVIMVESAGEPLAMSSQGAVGLAQVMPVTARAMGVVSGDLYEPRVNLEAGAKYLSWLIKRYGGSVDLALAAYNAGPEAVGRHRGIPTFKETKKFVDSVLTLYRWLQKNPDTWAMTNFQGMTQQTAFLNLPLVRISIATL